MPYQADTDRLDLGTAEPAATPHIERTPAVVSTDWRQALPLLSGRNVTLRELRRSDAPLLHAMLTTDEVARFINPPPTTVAGFEKFIAWTHRERAAGNYVCFGVVPEGGENAIGLFQVRSLESDFGTAEWGFILGASFWGSGLFETGARLVLDFAFETIGVHRMEARAAVQNVRGNGALRKLGAVQEGILRRSFLCRGTYRDQLLWSILDEDWRQPKFPDRGKSFHSYRAPTAPLRSGRVRCATTGLTAPRPPRLVNHGCTRPSRRGPRSCGTPSRASRW